MSDNEYEILIFEDKEENFRDLKEPLENDPRLEHFGIVPFPAEKTEPDDWDADEPPEAEDVLYPYLQDPYPDLVVLDWDLGGYQSGIRRQHVRSGCEEFGLPLCVYHRDEGRYSNPDELKEYEEDLIRLDVKETSEQVADSIAIIAKSFIEIKEALTANEVGGLRSALKQIINIPPSAEAQFEQYSLGQSTALRVAKTEMADEDRVRVFSTFLGYWIHNQLLEYPGVLLNEVAASSYLGVNHEQFKSEKACFEELSYASYEGPFSELQQDNWWWTNLLDEIRVNLPPDEDGELLSGPPLFRELCEHDLDHVRCVEGGERGAGYYCILTESPVCEDHSKQPSGWIPVGANRSRISTSELDEISGWVSE